MLGLGRWLVLFLFVFLFPFDFLSLCLRLCLRGLLLLGLLLLFCLGRLVLDGFVNETKFASNVGVDRLVAHSLVPSSDIGILLAPLLVEKELEAARDEAGGE